MATTEAPRGPGCGCAMARLQLAAIPCWRSGGSHGAQLGACRPAGRVAVAGPCCPPNSAWLMRSAVTVGKAGLIAAAFVLTLWDANFSGRIVRAAPLLLVMQKKYFRKLVVFFISSSGADRPCDSSAGEQSTSGAASPSRPVITRSRPQTGLL